MQGAIYEQGVTLNRLSVGWAAGGYLQQSRYFTDLGDNSFRVMNVNGTDIVPLVGLVLNYTVWRAERSYLRLNNLVSPVITNTSLSLGLEY